MLDLRALDADPDAVRAALSRRGDVPGLDAVISLAQKRRALVSALQTQQQERNSASKALGKASKEEIDAKRAELKALSQAIKTGEAELRALEDELNLAALSVPNTPAADVPDGADEDANVEVKRVGTPRAFEFDIKDHVDLGLALDIMDFERAAKVSGARFAFLKGKGSRLNRALVSFMADFHVERGDTEFTPPYLVRPEAMVGTGQLPKFEDDAFSVPRGDTKSYMIPTAEVPLTNYFADEILEEDVLPQRFCAYSACFRAEAGSAGRDTRGLIRQHQFEKVEMVRFCKPENAAAELDDMVARASAILTALELPHRIIELCTGDLGFSAEKTFDLEVWLPAQDKYREISSCSTTGSFQARRAKIRYRPTAEEGAKKRPKPQMLATLNGSGLAVGRTLVALLENHQQADGSIHVPEALRPYLGGLDVIR